MGFIKSFNFQENTLYNKYYDNNNRPHFSLACYKDEKILKLIDSCSDGKIRIWNFHTTELINVIDFGVRINNISLFNNKYIFISCYDYNIRILNLKNEIVEDFLGITQDIVSLCTIKCHNKENYLIVQGLDIEPISIYNFEISN